MSQGAKLSAAPGRGFSRIPTAVLLLIEVLVLVAVLVAAWKTRGAMPLVPTSDPDTGGYLDPALCWLSGLGFQQSCGRDWLYPALVTLFLKTTGSFAGIVLWQKFLAISSGVLMAVAWRCWVSTLTLHRWLRFLVSLTGALPIFIQLTNPQNILFEIAIRPEAVMSFFVYAQLACLMGYYKYRWQTLDGDRKAECTSRSRTTSYREAQSAGNALRGSALRIFAERLLHGGRSLNPEPQTEGPREKSAQSVLPSVIFGVAAIVFSHACLLLKPSWLLAFVITAAPVFVGIFGRTPSLKTRLLTPALGIALSVLLLWLPSAVFLIKDSDSVTLLPDALFAVHVRLIDNMLEARIAARSDSDPEKARLEALVTVLKSELKTAEADKPYKTLGFNPDYLMHSDAFTNAIYRYTGNDARKFSAFCISCYKDAALHDPLAFGRKVLVEFRQFLFPTRDAFYQRSHEFARFYRESAAVRDPRGEVRFRANEREMCRQYRADLAAQIGSSFRLDAKRIPTKLGRAFVLLALPLEILFLLSFVACFISPPLRELRLAGFAAFSLFSAPLGNAVTVCVVHSLDIYRYRHTYEGFLLFALVAMAVFTALVIARSARHAVGAWSEAHGRDA